MQIPLPAPPTDNLYKFTVLLCVFLFGFASVLPHILVEKLHSEYTAKLDEANKLGRELQLAIDFKQEKPELEKDPKVGVAADLIVAEAGNLGSWLNQRRQMLEASQYALGVTWYVSLLLGVAGLVAWYLQVQRFQDRVAKAEAEIKEGQLEAMGRQAPSESEPDNAMKKPSAKSGQKPRTPK